MARGTQHLTPPSSPAPTAGKGAASRERIVQAALNLFMERGYAETSIADIADASGLRKGNLSYYFATKADMLEAVTQARRDELFGRLQSALSADASARASLDAFLRVTEASAEEFARVGCPVGSLASQLGKADPELQVYASRILKALQSWLEGQFGRLLPAPAAKAHAEHLLALVQGAAIMSSAFRDANIVRRQVAQARIWLAGVLGPG